MCKKHDISIRISRGEIMKYEHINDVSKLKLLKQEKQSRIKREQEDIKLLDLRLSQISYEKENQLTLKI